MKTEYEKLSFIRTGSLSKKDAFGCYNKRLCDFTGQILWYEPFNAYCYFSDKMIAISETCLKELTDFVTQLNNQ